MHADFEKASEMISETDWDALASDDIVPVLLLVAKYISIYRERVHS